MATKKPAQKRHSRVSIVSVASKSLPQCTPNLMPFHIEYTGPAPVSTYFCVEDAKTHVGCPEPSLNEGSQSAPTESADEKLKVAQPASSEENGASSSGASSVPTQPRFISAFRGRTVQGLQVDLPEGYTGVVLRSEDDGTAKGNGIKSKGKGLVNSKGKGKQQEEKRFTRRSARSRISEDEEMDVDHEEEGDEEDKGPESTLNLIPSSQFKSFVLWHPDIPVDTGKDEYMSSMSEWIRISSVLHQAPT